MPRIRLALFATLILVAAATTAQAQTRTQTTTAPQGTVSTGTTGAVAVVSIASTANTKNSPVTATGTTMSVGSAEFLVKSGTAVAANATVYFTITATIPNACSVNVPSAVTSSTGLVSVKISGLGVKASCTLTAKSATASTTVTYTIN